MVVCGRAAWASRLFQAGNKAIFPDALAEMAVFAVRFSLRYPLSGTTMQPASFFTSLSSVFLMVVAGVLILVLEQLLLQGILEPALDLKDKIAAISKQLHLFNHQRSYHDENYEFTKNDMKIIGELSVEIYSLSSHVSLVYSKVNHSRCLFGLLRNLLGLPCLNKLQDASRELNQLSYELRNLNSPQVSQKAQENIKKLIPEIEKLLGIIPPPASRSQNPHTTR